MHSSVHDAYALGLVRILSPLIFDVFARCSTAGGDPFTARLLALFDACSDPVTGGPPQPLTLGVHRSDYMVDRGQDVSAKVQLLHYRHH